MTTPSSPGATTVTVRDLTLGGGRPAIIVPITATDRADTLKAARNIIANTVADQVDLVEWRIDHFEAHRDLDVVTSVMVELRQTLDPLPVLATFRTRAEGGAADISDNNYLALVRAVCTGGHADLVDVEYQREVADDCIAAAHDVGVPVVASNHDFHATPETDELVRRLTTMESMGADIAKIAVMPNSPQDVLTLLSATLLALEQMDSPIITMSMHRLGAASRLTGGVFGSCATFAALGEISAPGQLPVSTVAEVLDTVHGR